MPCNHFRVREILIIVKETSKIWSCYGWPVGMTKYNQHTKDQLQQHLYAFIAKTNLLLNILLTFHNSAQLECLEKGCQSCSYEGRCLHTILYEYDTQYSAISPSRLPGVSVALSHPRPHRRELEAGQYLTLGSCASHQPAMLAPLRSINLALDHHSRLVP